MWKWDPWSHPNKQKSTVDEVRNKFWQKQWSQVQSVHYIHFRFHSDSGTNEKGFQIEYNTKELFTACGGNYSNTTGIISSPSYPNDYPELADCVYLISQPNGTYVNISFITMDIDCQEVLTSEDLTSDYIDMRDGSSEESPLMGRFCGNGSNVPDFMQTTQNHLRLRWTKNTLTKIQLCNFFFILHSQILF